MGIMTDRKIEIVAVEKLKPHPKNPYKHSADQLKLLAKSISEYQWTVPIIANKDGTILSGHARVEVAKFLKRETVPVIYVDFTEKQALAYLICDNELTKKAELDFTLFADDILELDTGDFDINLVGLTDIDVEQAMTWAGKNSVVEDEAPPIPVKAKSKLGDIYELGNHRVMCADCTVKENIDKLMAGKKADMVFTDPPYGVAYSAKNEFRNNLDEGNRIQTEIQNDMMSETETQEFWYKYFLLTKNYLAKVHSYYIFSPQIQGMIMMMMMKAGMPYRHVLIWVKNNHVLGRTDYNYKHEPILFGWLKEGTHKFYGEGSQKFSVWNYDKPVKSDLHPTMKPIALIVNAILNSSKPSDIVLDSFLGSGSTLVACEQTKRVCYGMEIDPLYIDVIVSRYCNFVDNNKVIKNRKEMLW